MTERGSAPLLEQALLFTFVVHAAAMASMAALLLPGMPGGGVMDDAVRIAYIAGHPWLWRLGWLPWGLTALSDLLLAVALLRTPWVPRVPALVGALVTAAAVVPDQTGQIRWMTTGVVLAAEAVRSGDRAPYLAFEAHTFVITAACGATLYTVAALAWTWCFAKAGTWSRGLTLLSSLLWPLFAFVSLGPLLPPHLRPAPAVISAGNAVGFVLMEAWFALVAEQVLRRARPDATHGRYARWRHPSRGWLGRGLNAIGNSRFLRALAEWLPPVAMTSDIRDVVYVNYLVEAARLAPLLPEGLELQRLGPGGRHALFSFLTFRHAASRPAAPAAAVAGADQLAYPRPRSTHGKPGHLLRDQRHRQHAPRSGRPPPERGHADARTRTGRRGSGPAPPGAGRGERAGRRRHAATLAGPRPAPRLEGVLSELRRLSRLLRAPGPRALLAAVAAPDHAPGDPPRHPLRALRSPRGRAALERRRRPLCRGRPRGVPRRCRSVPLRERGPRRLGRRASGGAEKQLARALS